MKRSLVYSIIFILISTCAIAGNFVIHDMTTGIMHEAKDISNTATGEVSSVKVQDAISELDSEKVSKAGSITQLTTRNHADLQNITGNGPVHLSTGEKTNYDTAYTHSQNTTEAHNLTISDVAKKSGDLSQFTGTNLTQIGTRSHTSLTDIGINTHAQVDTHIANTTNPHGLTISNLSLKSGNLSQFSGGYAFKNLSDTPQSYAGKAGFYLRMNTDETALILDTPGIAPDETVKTDIADSTSGYLDAKITGSIALDAINHKLQLDGDIGAPGNYKFYGTNGSGAKAFYQIDHTTLSNIGTNNHATIDTHLANTTSVHGLTINDVALKSGSLSQFTTRSAADLSSGTLADGRLSSNVPLINGTNTFSGNCTFNNIISGNINGNAGTATNATTHINNTIGAHNITAITNGADKTGSLSQFTTRNASDINVTATAYGKGLSTNETTVQKVADRVNQNGTPQFVTDASKCSLLLDGLVDKTRGIVPVNYNSAVRWSDDFVNDNSSKEVATNLSCTLKQFEGDEGKFGSGVAVEESRTNLLLYSDDLTNGAWRTDNCEVTYNSMLDNNGAKLFKVTSNQAAQMMLRQYFTVQQGVTYTVSAFVKNIDVSESLTIGATDCWSSAIPISNKVVKVSYTFTATATEGKNFGLLTQRICTVGKSFLCSLPQLEVGAFPTSSIATGATTVTRPAERLGYPINMTYNQPFTISQWIKESSQTIYSGTPVLGNGGASYYFAHRIQEGTQNFNIMANEVSTSGIFTMPNFDTNWHHWVLKSDGTTLYFYVDKNLITSRTINTSIKSDYTDIGAGILNGTISNFAIFNYALTDAEISQIYNSGLEGKPVVCSNPVNHQDIVRETAGSPNNLLMPMFFGESVYDTTNNTWYKSKKIDNSSFVNPAWLQLN